MKKNIIFSTLVLIVLQACNMAANSEPVVSSSGSAKPKPSGLPQLPSIEEVREKQEKVFADKTKALSLRDPKAEALEAIQQGNYALKGVSQGRAGYRVVGVDNQKKCVVVNEVVLSDALFGPNHVQYQQAILDFTKRYNQTAYKYCQ